MYVSHLDNQVNEYYYDVMGSSNRDRVSSLILKPDAPVTTFAGRHTGYGVHESGNAYLGGVLIGFSNNKCKVPRILFVDGFISRDLANNQFNHSSSILGYNSSYSPNDDRETKLLNFCKNNNIDYVALYGLNYLFNSNLLVPGTTWHNRYHNSIKPFLKKFIKNGIRVGGITEDNGYTNGIATFNQVLINMNIANYGSAGKINFMIHEKEFWRAAQSNAPVYDLNGYNWKTWPPYQGSGNTIKRNEFFDHMVKEHKYVLQNMMSKKQNNSNFWEVFDLIYVSANYSTYNGNNCPESNKNCRRQIMRDLEKESDGIFVYYTSPHQYGPTNFLVHPTSSDPSGLDHPTGHFVDLWRNRLNEIWVRVQIRLKSSLCLVMNIIEVLVIIVMGYQAAMLFSL